MFANLHYNPWAFTGFYYGMSICVIFSNSVCLVFSRGFLIMLFSFCSEPMRCCQVVDSEISMDPLPAQPAQAFLPCFMYAKESFAA